LSTDLANIVNDMEVDKYDPDAVVANGGRWATALKDVMEKQKMYAVIQGKQYPEVEAWQMVIAFANLSPVTKYVEPIYEKDELVAYGAQVDLLNLDGVVVGGGYASCGMDGFVTNGKRGWDRNRAAQSAAQTWAVSKAGRSKFSFVVKMAGYEGTPAEELNPYVSDSKNEWSVPQAAVRPSPATNEKAPSEWDADIFQQGKIGKPITEKQKGLLNARLKDSNKSVEELKAYCKETFGIESSLEMTMDQLDETLEWLNA
jgi:hypothetical protein